MPTHASLFTGRFPHELSVDWLAPLDGARPTLAEVLRRDGYATAGFVANLNYCSAETGLDRGFEHYEDYPVSLGQMVLDTALGRALTNAAWFRELLDWHDNLNRKGAARVNRDFLRWLDGARGERPFLAFLNYYDAHQPYLPPAPFAGEFGPIVRRGRFRYDTNQIGIEDWTALSPEQLRMEQDSYDAAVKSIDAEVGALLRELERRGRLAQTLVIITSDHGEQFGEHQLYDHGNSLYLPAVHVPLVILMPGGAAAGTTVDTPVSLRDLAATIAGVAGAAAAAELPGQSLARYCEPGAAAGAEGAGVVLSEVRALEGAKRQGLMRSLLVGRYHYIRNGDGSPELYDIDYDPDEVRDLAALANGREALALFEETLKLIVERQ